MCTLSRYRRWFVHPDFSRKEMSLCFGCSSPTNYVFELQDDCASEETTGWKAGLSVGYCANCSKAASAKSKEKAKGTKEKTAKTRGTKEENHSKRKCLRLDKKWKWYAHFKTVRKVPGSWQKDSKLGRRKSSRYYRTKRVFLRHGLLTVLSTEKDQTMKNCRRLTVYYGKGIWERGNQTIQLMDQWRSAANHWKAWWNFV